MAAQELPQIYIVSGGVGSSGEQVVNTVLAQFPGNQIRTVTLGNVRTVQQLEQVVERACTEGSFIVHTLVDENLRAGLVRLVEQFHIPASDLMGDLLAWLQNVLGRKPAGLPGLYRQLNQDYFDRVAAIEYSMEHDDGKKPQEWDEADMLLVGPSRVGKTPLSLFLSVLGWKVANVPFVPEINLPPQLEEMDKQRVFGLIIAPGQLVEHRLKRQSRLGASGPSAYTDPEKIHEELTAARRFFRQQGFTIINVTDKPIESTADEIIHRMTGFNLDRLGGI
jgi:regulator of PEP synthase PpsR (kinase-PPPase family)